MKVGIGIAAAKARRCLLLISSRWRQQAPGCARFERESSPAALPLLDGSPARDEPAAADKVQHSPIGRERRMARMCRVRAVNATRRTQMLLVRRKARYLYDGAAHAGIRVGAPGHVRCNRSHTLGSSRCRAEPVLGISPSIRKECCTWLRAGWRRMSQHPRPPAHHGA
eukprot:6602113-Prymnesium_polylepis.1